MAENLKIKDFGPIKSAELKDIKQLLVIVGESGSGKSTILKVLSMCRWIYKQQNIRSYLHNAGISRSPFSHNINSYLDTTGMLDYVDKGSEIVFERDGVIINIKGVEKARAGMTVTEPSLSELCLEKVCFITEKRNTLPDLLAARTSDKFAGYYVKDLFENFRTATNHIKTLKLSAVDVNLRLEKNKGNENWMIDSIDEKTGPYSIHLEDASSGIQSSMPLDLMVAYYTRYYDLNEAMNNAILKYLANTDALKYFRPTINVGEIQTKCIDLLVEEPEMCLYPANQMKLMSALIASTVRDEHPFTIRTSITTHSPYLLNYLNLLFKANDKGVTVSGASLDYDAVSVYAVVGGCLKNLKVKNAHLIDPAYLSEPIDSIYGMYEQFDVMEKQAEEELR